MKKKLMLIIAVIVVVVTGVAALVYARSARGARLSQEEIAVLREQYPVNDRENPLYCRERFPVFEEDIARCDRYVVAEVVSGPDAYDRGITPTTMFTTYEIKIVEDIFGNASSDTIEISYNSGFDIEMPEMEIGSRFVIGGMYDEKRGEINIGSDMIFYVTEDDYVLSVKSEETRDAHTGSRVSDLIEYIRSVKKAAQTGSAE
ncbi:MAG: hypothetical protein IJZ85_10570 [Lachnospiraceae bacterium]|nr:hypothetical protein [Lachnospiraceae bacterium]